MRTKDRQRQEIAAHVRDYLARGGRIEQVPAGASGVVIEISKRLRKANGQKLEWGSEDAE
jgi:hypothetical protein